MKTIIKTSCLIIIALFFYSCSHVDEPILEKSLPITDDVALILNYDLITSTFLLPMNSGEVPNISSAEQVLSTPVFEGRRVQQFINADGSVDGEVIVMDFEEMPDYPDKRIGNPILPEESQINRISIENGVSTFYNMEGEVIGSQVQDAETSVYLQQLAQEVSKNVELTEDEFDLALQGFEQAGFSLTNNTSDNIAELSHTFPDGRRTAFYIDKSQQRIRSRAHYDAQGQLEIFSDYEFEDEDNPSGLPVLKSHRFVTFYDDAISGIRMGIWKVSHFKSFEMIKNN